MNQSCHTACSTCLASYKTLINKTYCIWYPPPVCMSSCLYFIPCIHSNDLLSLILTDRSEFGIISCDFFFFFLCFASLSLLLTLPTYTNNNGWCSRGKRQSAWSFQRRMDLLPVCAKQTQRKPPYTPPILHGLIGFCYCRASNSVIGQTKWRWKKRLKPWTCCWKR
jgi:hypothetical protein